MSEVESFVCPTCGAPLEIKGHESQIKCEFCGNVVVVPEHLRARPAFQTPMEAPVIMVQFPTPVVESPLSYTGIQDRRRTGGCFWRLFAVLIILIVVGATTLPFILTNALLRDQIMGVINSAISQSFGQPTATRRPGVVVPGGTRTPTPFQRQATKASDGAALIFGGDGTGSGLFRDPRHIAIDGDGSIYVSDFDTGRIQRLDPEGNYLNGWMLDGKKPIVTALAADRAGTVYVVVNTASANILKYEGATGKLLGKISGDKDSFQDLAVLPDGRLQAFVSHNYTSDDLIRITADGKISNRVAQAISTQTDSSPLTPHLAVDGLGNVFVLSNFDYAVFKFTASGKYVNRFGQRGNAQDQFQAFQNAIAVDAKGNVYVSDFKGIMVFDSSGRYLDLIKLPANPAYSMAFNARNELYVLMRDARVLKLNAPDSAQ
jgi:DNA-binding beta-propeller fold protein YncE/DNA-directed RNA polymerase subunit RPC12/RpoP